MKRISFICLAIGVAAFLAGTPGPAAAQAPYKPVQATLGVNPSYFRGGCPVTLKLTTTFTLPPGTPSEAFSGGFVWVPLLPGLSLGNAFPQLAVTGGTPTTDTVPVTVTKTAAGWFVARVATFKQYGSFASQSNHADFTVQCIAGIAPGQSLTVTPGNGAGGPGGYTPPNVGSTVHVPYPKSQPPHVPPSLHPGPPPPYAAPVAAAGRPAPIANAAGAAGGVRVFSKIIAGRCALGNPTREYFSGAIYMNGKPQVALQYRWIRSDGATGAAISATAVSSHQLIVRDEWDLRTVNYSGWEAVQILSLDGAPVNIQSNHASFVCSGRAPAGRPR